LVVECIFAVERGSAAAVQAMLQSGVEGGKIEKAVERKGLGLEQLSPLELAANTSAAVDAAAAVP
jgi:hypothetical protein